MSKNAHLHTVTVSKYVMIILTIINKIFSNTRTSVSVSLTVPDSFQNFENFGYT